MKPLNLLIAEIRGGLPLKAANDLLADALRSAQDSGKKATVTITLEISPHGKENKEMHISLKSTAKLPVPSDLNEPGIFYYNHGKLTRDDPNQQPLGLSGVERADGGAPADDRTGTYR